MTLTAALELLALSLHGPRRRRPRSADRQPRPARADVSVWFPDRLSGAAHRPLRKSYVPRAAATRPGTGCWKSRIIGRSRLIRSWRSLRPRRDPSRAPLFQTMLIWKDRGVQMQFMELEGLTVSPLTAHARAAKYDLTLYLTDAGDEIWLEVEYCTDLFSAGNDRPDGRSFPDAAERRRGQPRGAAGLTAAPDRRRTPPSARRVERHPG